jgi:hypothetical protein
MPRTQELHSRLMTLVTSVESAITEANLLARHQIIVSENFDRCLDHLHQAAELLDQMVGGPGSAILIRLPERKPPRG